MRDIFTSYDNAESSSNVFAGIAVAVCSLLKSPAIKFNDHSEYIEAQFLRHYRSFTQGKPPAFNLALYSDADGTSVSNDYAAALAIECQIFLCSAIHALAAPLSSRLSDALAAPGAAAAVGEGGMSEGAARDRATVRRMIESCWAALLTALSVLLARCSSEETIQELLKCYQSFTQACGILDLIQPRDEFLSSLCFYALPPRPRQVR